MQIKAADAHDQLALVSPFLLQTLADVAEAKGVSAERLCRGLGFTLDDLQDPTLRISYRQAVAMIERALAALPQQGLGLWVGSRNVLGTLGLLGHALSLCRTWATPSSWASAISTPPAPSSAPMSGARAKSSLSSCNAACPTARCRSLPRKSSSPAC